MAIVLGIFGLGGWEMVLLLAIALLLFGMRKLPDIYQGLNDGFSEFRNQSDQAAHAAGKSLGGIYGKPAAEALTADNQVAEFYEPAAFEKHEGNRHSRKPAWLRRSWHWCQATCRRVLRLLEKP